MKCDVEYDRECGMARKRREYVAGYRKGNCKQIVKEKCYRRRIGKSDDSFIPFHICVLQELYDTAATATATTGRGLSPRSATRTRR